MPHTKAAPPITRYDYQQMLEGPPYYQVVGVIFKSPLGGHETRLRI
ncbi:MAG TPA: hypothetical protein VG146_13050 [Verrucomicrobiae bacterium]|nr:hypothetical protein [Verrucomicrobiae bacterium]